MATPSQPCGAEGFPIIFLVNLVDFFGKASGRRDGRTFVAMELMEGQTLRYRIAGKPLQIDAVLDLGIQIADAFDGAIRMDHPPRHPGLEPVNLSQPLLKGLVLSGSGKGALIGTGKRPSV